MRSSHGPEGPLMCHLLRASVLPGKFRCPKIALASGLNGIYWVLGIVLGYCWASLAGCLSLCTCLSLFTCLIVYIRAITNLVNHPHRSVSNGADDPKKVTRQSNSRPDARQSFHKPTEKACESKKKDPRFAALCGRTPYAITATAHGVEGHWEPIHEPCTSQDDPFATIDYYPGTEIRSDPIYVCLPFLSSSLFVQTLIRVKARANLKT